MARKILVIDDEEAIIIVVTAALEVTADWKVISTASAAAGIDLAKTLQPDAILLDVSMPKMDGTEVFRHLQKDAVTQQIPVIFLTAKARSSDQQSLIELGVAGIILKPFSPQTLAAKIRNILAWKD